MRKRDVAGHENFIFLSLLETLLNCLIRPVRPGVKHFEVDEFDRLGDWDRLHPGFIRNIWRKHDVRELHNRRMNFEKNRVANATILSRKIFHRMITAKTQVHVMTHAL